MGFSLFISHILSSFWISIANPLLLSMTSTGLCETKTKRKQRLARLLHSVNAAVCVRGLLAPVGDFCVITQLPLKKGGANRQCVYVCLSPSQSARMDEKRKEGVTWHNHSYYEIAGVHFNSTWPCQGHHMPACLPGLLETQCYWTKAAAPQRHTQQLFSVATYHLMTHTEGNATHDCSASLPRGYQTSQL